MSSLPSEGDHFGEDRERPLSYFSRSDTSTADIIRLQEKTSYYRRELRTRESELTNKAMELAMERTERMELMKASAQCMQQ
mmetsp:Transcript_7319/g.19001  ORF Transcript_7319/g.19001 Transcript_7319/m.19001 type:complete len:81 (-) Transcript_7319:703-945(-)